MKVTCVFTKRIEVEAELTEDEIKKVCTDGVPVRVWYEATKIDENVPLEFQFYREED